MFFYVCIHVVEFTKGGKMKNLLIVVIGFLISFASVASPHPLIDQGIEDEGQTIEALRTQPVQVVLLDPEGKCLTYHSVSGDVSSCDAQAENLVNSVLLSGVSQENILMPVGQVASASVGELLRAGNEGMCDHFSVGLVASLLGTLGLVGTTVIVADALGTATATSLVAASVPALAGIGVGLILFVLAHDGVVYMCNLNSSLSK